MKTVLKLCIIACCTFAFAASPMTPDALVKDATRLDGKDVAVVGKVKDYSEKTSKIGNAYTIFKLAGAKSAANVYLKGRPVVKIKDGLTVEVSGVFRMLKKLSKFTVKNEIDASAVAKKPYGIKLAKPTK